MTSTGPVPTSLRIYREPSWLRLLVIASLLLGAFQIQLLMPREVFAAAPCEQYTGTSYTVNVCITAPANGITVSGDVTATTTVTPVSGTVPAIDYVRWYLSKTSSSNTSTLGTDYASPYTFQVPTYRWTDGSYRLEAVVRFVDGYTTPISNPARVLLTLANGVTSTPSSNGSWGPKAGGVTNIVAVGDGAGGLPGANAVGSLAQSLGPSQLLYLGDVYNSGTYTEFYNYYRPTLGPLDGITNPVPGNHESGNNFRGYRDYWNQTATPYYSYNSGGWHFIALDSTTQFGQTAAGTAQYNWLAQDLQANAATSCTLVFFHHPRFGLTSTAGNDYMQDIWSLLATSGVDVVVTGHEHNYQRWLPMDSAGNVVNNGMVQYVVGTGGHELMSFGRTDSRVAARISGSDGVLQLSLGSSGGTSRFISTSGLTSDQASFNCHDGEGSGTPTPTPVVTPTPTSTPGGPSSTFLPAADARVEEANATTNFGASSLLRSDGGSDPDVETYLRFDVAGVTGTPTSAVLRLYVPPGANTGSVDGPALYTATNSTWSETGITWSNRPTRGTTTYGDLAGVSAGTWVEFNVSPVITGNGSYAFVLATSSNDATDFASRETGTPPQLVLYGVTATPVTPTPTPITPTPTPTQPPSGSSTTLAPVADARVQEANTGTNYGTSTLLRSDAGTGANVESYLRFDVSGVTGTPTSAVLRLFVQTGSNAGSANGPELYVSSNTTWSETGITWANKPARTTTAIGDLGKVTAGTWVEYDVSAIVTGNGSYTFVLSSVSTDATDFNSRETSTPPQLVLYGLPATTPTATATASPTTPTPAVTPTTVAETPTATTPPTEQTQALTPVADSMVQAANPDTNYGTWNNLRSDGSPEEWAYLMFDVQGTNGSVTQATLRMYVRDGTKNGPRLALSPDTSWSETGITWNNKPGSGTELANLGSVSTGTWIEIDVTSAIAGDGPITFVLLPESSDALSVNSRQNITDRPELVIISGGSGQATMPAAPVSPTATAGATATPTSTAETPVPTTTPATSLTLGPAADSMVQTVNPDTNYGTWNNLRSDGSPEEWTYLMFDVQGTGGTVASATLRLYVRDGTKNGPQVALSTDTSWTETGVTWNNKPGYGPVMANLGSVSTGTWIEIDVSGAVGGDGLITFVLLPESSDALSVNSRQNGTDTPELVIVTDGSGQAGNMRVSSAMAVESAPVETTPTPAPAEATPTVVAETPVASPTATDVAPPATTVAIVTGTGSEGLRCRATASLDGDVLVVLAEGETVIVRGDQQGDWLPVTCAGVDGYVSAAFVVLGAAETTPAPADATPTPTPDGTVPTEVAVPTVDAVPTEATVPEATLEPTPEPTPLAIVNGWQPDPNVPWWWMTDNDLNTAWSGAVSTPGGTVEAGFDLGSVQPIEKLRMQATWPLQGMMEIQLSEDGVTWFHLRTVDLSLQTADTWVELPVGIDARYVNLAFTDPYGNVQIGTIRELQVWAAPDGVAEQIRTLTEIVPTPVPVPTEAPIPTAEPYVPPPAEIVPTDVPPPADAPPPAEPTVEVVPADVPPPAEEPPANGT